jgi:methylated-DNA-[protein]-cysteine S-methyltransferase
MNYYRILKTKSLGDLLLVANQTHLIGMYFRDSQAEPPIHPDWKLDPRFPILSDASKQIETFLTGERTEFSIPLHYAGTPFQESVWREIAAIPFGQTITYTDLATRAGAPKATRAAGTATGKNRLGIIIPCHRVVASNGGLGGFAGGLDRKKRLLELEGIAIGRTGQRSSPAMTGSSAR